jgi:hypothetical protein
MGFSSMHPHFFDLKVGKIGSATLCPSLFFFGLRERLLFLAPVQCVTLP